MNLNKIKGVLSIIMAALICSSCGKTDSSIKKEVASSIIVGDVVELFDKNSNWVSSDESIATIYEGRVVGFSSGKVKLINNKTKEVYYLTVENNKHRTTHVYFNEESDTDLIKNGISDYVVVYPHKEEDELIKDTATSELVHFFKQATGVTLKVISDRGLKYDENSHYLSIGETSLLSKANVTIDKNKLGENGFRIVTKGESVFMIGGGRFGHLYSVYEFLKWQFNYEQYAVDEYSLEENVKDKKLIHFETIDIPDFQWRLGNNGEYWNGGIFASRMRMQTVDDIWIQLGGLPWHNFKATIPPSVHKASHPDWFSPDGLQLCLSRDVEGLSNEVLNQLKRYIEANPHLSNVTFTQEDIDVWCSCPSCRALKKQYGVNSASNIRFINVVAKKLKSWLRETHPERQITLVIFAYHQVEAAPAIYNANTDKYIPIDESVVLEDNVAVMYAPIFANHYQDFYDENNNRVDKTMKMWQALTDKIYLWCYSTYFVNYLMPFDSFNAMQNKYIYAYENNVTYLFDQQQYNQQVGTDWFKLKEYLSSKMSWNVYQDMNILIDNFFNHYFKDAGSIIKEYFNQYRTHWAYLSEEYGVNGTIGESISYPQYWPYNTLNNWLSIIEKAKNSLKDVKEKDANLYQVLLDRLVLETISLRHLLINLYKDNYSEKEYIELYTSFKKDCERLGVSNYNEWNALQQVFNLY